VRWRLVSGDFDDLLKLRVADMAAYRELLGRSCATCPAWCAIRAPWW
jgi:hypothetical protein